MSELQKMTLPEKVEMFAEMDELLPGHHTVFGVISLLIIVVGECVYRHVVCDVCTLCCRTV